MNQEQKLKIIEAAKAYMQDKKVSAAQLAQLSEINPAYISSMMNGEFVIGEKQTPITPKWFKKLASVIGYDLGELTIATQSTDQFKQIINALETGRTNCAVRVIVGGTGTGKTETAKIYKKKHPTEVYMVTVSPLHSLHDILDELCMVIGVPRKARMAAKLQSIAHRLRWKKDEGYDLQIVIDESENLKVPVLGMVKALYDVAHEYASISMIATPDLLTKLDKLLARNAPGVPQFVRRVKAGIVHIKAIDKVKDYEPFFQQYVKDANLRKLLLRIADNYGELCDYLLPVLRRAKEDGVELNEAFFRLYYGNKF